MNLGFLAQERSACSALTVVVSCVNRTQRHAASVTAYSVLRACPSIGCSTPNLHMGNVENEKELRAGNKTSAHFVLESSFNGVTSLD